MFKREIKYLYTNQVCIFIKYLLTYFIANLKLLSTYYTTEYLAT